MDPELKKQLEDLKQLYDTGVITEDVWKEKQRHLLLLKESSSASIVRVAIPEEIGGGVIFTNATIETSGLNAKLSVLEKIKTRFDDSPSGCVPLDAPDFVLTIKAFSATEDLDEKFFVKDDVPILKAGLPTDSGTHVAWLINISGREACGPIKQPEKIDLSAPKKETKKRGSMPLEPWGDLVLTNLDAKEEKLASRWTSNRAVVSLVRRFG